MRVWQALRFGLMILALVGAGKLYAADPWIVRNFRVEGAQRISEGTMYNYLPINIGDTLDEQRYREAIRALFDTGFFQDIELRRDGDTLVIAVLERPTIQEFTFEGNKDIKDEDLEKSLTDIGLARGKTFDRSVLDDVTQSLTEEYYGRGKYGAKVEADVENGDVSVEAAKSIYGVVIGSAKKTYAERERQRLARKASVPRFARSTSSATRSSMTSRSRAGSS